MNKEPIVNLNRLIYNAGVTSATTDIINLENYTNRQGRSYYDYLVIQRKLFETVEKCLFENKSITVKDYLNLIIKLESEYERE